MKDYYNDNIAVIKQSRPQLYQALIQLNNDVLQNQYPELQKISSQVAKDGETVMTLRWDGRDVRLNSAYSPKKEAEKWCDQYCFNNLDITVMLFGMGNGVILRELKKRLYSDAEVIVYEPSMKLFDYVLHNEDLTELLNCPTVTFIIQGLNEDSLFHEIHKRIHWSRVLTQIRCFHPKYEELFGEAAVYFLQQIKKCNELASCNRNTQLYFTTVAVENLFSNLPHVLHASTVNDCFGRLSTEVPAIVVAAGPSLNKNIDELKKAEGKAFIMATDTAVRGLLEHDIHFDCMITVDPEKPSSYISDVRCKDIPLFCSLESNPPIMQFHSGKKIWFQRDIYLKELYDKYGKALTTCVSGGSVATTAFSIAVTLGFHQIILVGQDLAFHGNKTHAEWVESEGDDTEITLVESVDGEMVRSRPDWLIFLMWYEEVIAALPEIEVIDATEGGALIHGSRLLTLSQAIQECCNEPVDYEREFEKISASFTEKQCELIKKDLLNMEYEFEKIRKYAEEGIGICHLIEECTDCQKQNYLLDKNLGKLSGINNKIVSQLSYELVDRYIAWDANDVMNSVNVMTDDQRKNQLSTVEKARIVYEAYIKAVEKLKPFVKELDNTISHC